MTKITIRPSGIVEDINAAEAPPEVWNAGNNVVFKNGFTRAFPGYAPAASGNLYKPQWLLPVVTPTTYYWIYGGINAAGDAGGIGVTDGTNHFDITPAGGIPVTTIGDWTGGMLNGIPVINHGKGPPLYWDLTTSNPCLPLPDWPENTTCEALRPFKYHLIAMNITDASGEYPDLVLWSNAANPGAIPDSWTPAADNDAGNFAISTPAGSIIDGGAMRDQFVVYKQHSTSIMQYVAGQFVFSNRKAFVTTGILARNCWAEYGGSHYVLTDGDLIQHDGQQVQSLIQGKMKEWLFSQIDADNYTRCCMVSSHERAELLVGFPQQGEQYLNKGLVYDVTSGSFGVVDLAQLSYLARGILSSDADDLIWEGNSKTWDQYSTAWNTRKFNPTTDTTVMSSEVNNHILLLGSGYTADGQPIPVHLNWQTKDLGSPQQLKLVKAIWLNAEVSTTTGFIRVGVQKNENDPIDWGPQIRVEQNSLGYFKADMLRTGRFISLEFTADQNSEWRFNSIDIDHELMGYS